MRTTAPENTERKPDTRRNGRVPDEVTERQRERERHLFPIRVNAQTVIYVTRDKCNADYAAAWLRRVEKAARGEPPRWYNKKGE